MVSIASVDNGQLEYATSSGGGAGLISPITGVEITTEYNDRVPSPFTWSVDIGFVQFSFPIDFDTNLNFSQAILTFDDMTITNDGLIDLRLSATNIANAVTARTAHDEFLAELKNVPLARQYSITSFLQHLSDTNSTLQNVVVFLTASNHIPREAVEATWGDATLEYEYTVEPKVFAGGHYIQDDLSIQLTEGYTLDNETLTMTDDVTVSDSFNVLSGVLEDTLIVVDAFSTDSPLVDNVSITDAFTTNTPGVQTSDSLTVSQSFVGYIATIRDSLTVTDSFKSETVYTYTEQVTVTDAFTNESLTTTRTFSDTITITGSHTFSEADPTEATLTTNVTISESYVANGLFVGAGAAPVGDCVTELGPGFEVTDREFFTLGTVDLPHPVLNDRQVIDLGRARQEALSGKLGVQAAGSTVEWRRYEFQDLSEAKRDEYLTFIEDNLGLEITVTTHETEVYTGIVDDVQKPRVQDSDQGCDYVIGFSIRLT